MRKFSMICIMVCALFVGTISAISADEKTLPESGVVIYLTYGQGNAADRIGDSSYKYYSVGKHTGGTGTGFSVYVKNSAGTTMSSDGSTTRETVEAIWFSSGNVRHSHTAISARYQ